MALPELVARIRYGRLMSMMIHPRWLAFTLAKLGGYFWLPCPICDQPFAGFEASSAALMTSLSDGFLVCGKPECKAEASRRSEEAYAKRGIRIVEAVR